jgi:hypothetical protein
MSATLDTSVLERERQQLLKTLLAEEGREYLEGFRPGTFGCHELLDRASLLGDAVEENILNHPACVQNPEWYALAERALAALRELYQEVGAAKPTGSDSGEVEALT